MNELIIAASWIAAYLVGSVNFSIIASKLFKTADPRQHGSRNAGATNLMRSAGYRVAVPVLLLDIFRGFAIVHFCADLPVNIWWPFIALPLLAGNIFPVFHSFKGGKGVATSIGILMALAPFTFLMSLAIAIAVLGIFRRVSPVSLALLTGFTSMQFVFEGCCPESLLAAILLISAFVTHRDNIRRLYRNTEPKVF